MAGIGGVQPRRSRSLIVVAVVTMLLGVLTAAAVGVVIVAESFERLEEAAVAFNINRLQSSYDAEVDKLAVMAGDWGMWDDSYDFTLGMPADYVESNLADETLENLSADVIALYAADHTLLHAAYIDPATGQGAPPPRGIALLAEPLWPEDLSALDAHTGLIMDETGLFICAVHPITNSDASAEPNGLILFARYADEEFIEAVEHAMQLEVSRVELEDFPTEDDDGDPRSEVRLEPDVAHGTRVFMDTDERPALALQFAMSRSVADYGRRALASFMFTLGMLSLVLLVVLLAALRQEQHAFERQRVAEEAATRMQQRYRALVEGMADAVLSLDAGGVVTFANPEASRLLGRPIEALQVLGFRDIMTPESADIVSREVLPSTGAGSTRDLVLVDANGATINVEVGIAWFTTAPGAPLQMQWIMRDVSDRKRFERELLHLATHDHLTGLHNRLRFEEELETRLQQARRGDRETVLLWLDLDNFKEVNDSLGHKSGDDLLVTLSIELSRRLRADSVLARLGGDEFGILIPGATADDASSVATRVLEDIRALEFAVDGGRVRMTASIGVVLLPDHATTSEEALARADIAMYRAKAYGGNRFCMFEPGADWQDELRARFDWAGTLESALLEDRMIVYWQPIIDLTTGETDRYELLVRMTDAEGQVVPPGVFLPVAEQLGLIAAIDHHMVRRAITLLAEYPPDSDVRFDVNCSGRALSDTSLLETIAKELERTGVNPGRLGIEITETAAVVDMVKAQSFIVSLKSIGVRVALDDFGSGFSSFHYLRNLPVDMLKIDGSFVRELPDNPRDQHIVRSMVELAAGLGIQVTAEWVESEETLRLLRSFGVGFAQGYWMGRPCEVGTDPASVRL